MGPGQLLPAFVKVGVTTIVPVIGAVPVLVAVNEISPLPVAGSPMAVIELVHEYVVVPPVFTVANPTLPALLLHKTIFTGWVT